MEPSDESIDLLQNLEFSIATMWRAHPEMNDYTGLRAYEAAIRHYRDEERGHTPKPPALSGLDAITFDSLKEMCEFRLGRGGSSGEELPIQPVSLEKLVAALRKLAKSVERHTRMDGKQGYLTFIDGFLP